eukprot:335271_1
MGRDRQPQACRVCYDTAYNKSNIMMKGSLENHYETANERNSNGHRIPHHNMSYDPKGYAIISGKIQNKIKKYKQQMLFVQSTDTDTNAIDICDDTEEIDEQAETLDEERDVICDEEKDVEYVTPMDIDLDETDDEDVSPRPVVPAPFATPRGETIIRMQTVHEHHDDKSVSNRDEDTSYNTSCVRNESLSIPPSTSSVIPPTIYTTPISRRSSIFLQTPDCAPPQILSIKGRLKKKRAAVDDLSSSTKPRKINKTSQLTLTQHREAMNKRRSITVDDIKPEMEANK